MKKIFILIVLMVSSFFGFSQSFSADNKSLLVPRYASQTAINAAIPTPVEGMLVYNNALDQFSYYNGTAWTSLLSTSSPSPTYTTSVPIPVYSNAATINSIASPVTGMLVYNVATSEVWFRGATAWAAMPTATTPWATTDDNITYVGTGRTLAAGANSYAFPSAVATLNSVGETNASPIMMVQSFAGNQNRIRYEAVPNYQEQIFTHSSTPANAKIEWLSGSSSPAYTQPCFDITGDGDYTGHTFTAFGEITTGTPYNPGIATKTFTGTTSSILNDNTIINHGISADRIVDVKVLVFDGTSLYASRSFGVFNVYFTASQIRIIVNNNSYLSKNFVAYVTYIN